MTKNADFLLKHFKFSIFDKKCRFLISKSSPKSQIIVENRNLPKRQTFIENRIFVKNKTFWQKCRFFAQTFQIFVENRNFRKHIIFDKKCRFLISKSSPKSQTFVENRNFVKNKSCAILLKISNVRYKHTNFCPK